MNITELLTLHLADSGLDSQIVTSLEKVGYATIGDVLAASQAELIALPGFGAAYCRYLIDTIERLQDAEPPKPGNLMAVMSPTCGD